MLIRTACYNDLYSIYKIMDEVDNPWFYKDDRKYVLNHIEKEGFILVVENNDIIAYLMIHYVEYDKDADLHHIAYMDSVGVLPIARGHSLMKKMIIEAENILKKEGYSYFMATVHPDNLYSLNVLKSLNYHIIKTVYRYENMERYLLLKNEEITLR